MILGLSKLSFFEQNCYQIGSSEFGRFCGMYSLEANSQKNDWQSSGIRLDVNKQRLGCQLVHQLEVNLCYIGCQLVVDWYLIVIELISD
jgi:hypothetical protein